MEEKKDKYDLTTDLVISRSNELIQARYKSSLLENQILVLSLMRAKRDEFGRPSVTISSNELLKLTGIKNHNIYKQLKDISKDLIDITFYLENPEDQKFKYFNLVNNAEYNNGSFTINFTPDCNALLYELQGNFTTMSLSMLFSFSSNYSFRLYEVLKVHAYKIDSANTPYDVELSLADLKLQLGCINTDEKKVKDALKSDDPDPDYIVNELATKKKYDAWYDFKRFVLDRAMKEINEKTDLSISYKPIRSGRGAKIQYVKFTISRKDVEKRSDTFLPDLKDKLEKKQSVLVEEVRTLLKEVKITKKDANALLKVSENDIERIKVAYEIAKMQPEITNFMGWMMTAIKDGYEKPIEVSEGSQEKSDVVNQMRNNIEENKEELAETLWRKVQENENYPEFSKYILETTNLNMYLFEGLLDPAERFKYYREWLEKNK